MKREEKLVRFGRVVALALAGSFTCVLGASGAAQAQGFLEVVVERIFPQLDADGSGEITLEEARAWERGAVLVERFSQADADGSEGVSKSELTAFLRSLRGGG